MSTLLDRLPAEQRGRVRPVAHGAAGRVAEQPMLAVLSVRRSFDDGWVFEPKLDGVRAIGLRDGDLRHRLDGRQQGRSPFDDEIRERAVHWVRPELVAQIGFTEWTRTGMLRHPRFLGLRDDKRAADVVREQPVGGPR
ncbi:ATP-dependent DNA ligase [Streptomyces sp. V1I1]|nr:ATP-dependent DNA ligase [Streptomyces sp. V1I1]